LQNSFTTNKDAYKSGEIAEIYYAPPLETKSIEAELVDPETNKVVEKYKQLPVNNDNIYTIQRILNTPYARIGENILRIIYFDEQKQVLGTSSKKITLEKSLAVKSICGSDNCEYFTGNAVQGVLNKLIVVAKGFSIHEQKITVSYKVNSDSSEFSYVVSEDSFQTPREQIEIDITFPNVPEYAQFYTANILIETNMSTEKIDSNILLRIVRPIEIINEGVTRVAQIFDPVPMSGCIPGSLGTNVTYQESSTETRQQSVSISKTTGYTLGKGTSYTSSASESLGISTTNTISNASQISETSTASESDSTSYNESESNNFNFTTTDGENWSWSRSNSTSETEGITNTSGNSTGVNGSVTVGTSGDASIPLLGKVSGKFETTAGVSTNWNNSTSDSQSSSNSTSSGYMTSNSNSDSTSYGSQYSITKSQTLTGTFSFSMGNSFSMSESESNSSSRVWDFSESNTDSLSTTESNSEAFSKTIVESSSQTISTSNTSYIPPRRFGKWYRQTTRNVKQSMILIYDVDGFVVEVINVNYNTWSFATSMAISDSCETINSNFPRSQCLILPCE
jgi:hypothetical protein